MKQIEQTITTLEIAEMMGMQHFKILAKIDGTKDGKTKGIIPTMRKNEIVVADYFKGSTYQDLQNKVRKCYLVTKMGCDYLANKFTGEKGIVFTAKYVKRFHDMEQQISNPISTEDQIRVIAQGTTELYQKIDGVKQDLEDFKQDLPLLGIECQKITRAKNHKVVPILGGKNSPAYKDSSLRGKVYSDIQKEICRQFGVESYKEIKRCQVDKAIEIIKDYELPMMLEEQVTDCNAQMAM